VSYASTTNLDYDGAIDAWSGWGDLKGDPQRIFILDRPDQLVGKLPKAGATVLRAKFIIYPRVDGLQPSADGTLRLRRADMEDVQVNEALAAIVRLKNQVAASTDGNVDFQPDVEIREEIERVDLQPGMASLPTEAWRNELEVATNGGSFAAEDKQYRGPYHVGFVISALSPNLERQFAPLGGIWNSPSFALGYYGPHSFGIKLDQAVRETLLFWSVQKGANKWPAGAEWAKVLSFDEPTIEQQLAVFSGVPAAFDVPSSAGVELGVRSADTAVSLVADPEKGQVLSVTERSVGRTGGASLVVPGGGIDPKQTPTLTFSLKQDTPEPVALWFNGTTAVTLGSDRLATDKLGQAVPFDRNGTWQTVQVSLKDLGLDLISSIAVRPAPGAFLRGKIQNRPIEVRLTDFKLVATPTSNLPEPPLSELDQRISAATKFGAETPEDVFIAALKDTEEEVAMNAIQKLPRPLSVTLRAALTSAASSIEGRVAQLAVRRLASEPDATTPTEMRRIMQFGITDAARVEAALVVAQGVDPKEAGYISVLLGDRRAAVRRGGLKALAKLKGREAGIIRMAYITQVDPMLKSIVTDSSDPNDEYQMRKLLWSAVNEPWDAVRLKSCLKLIQSNVPEFRKDGYRGIKDDSIGVRLSISVALANTPTEAHRDALRLAVVDSDSRVRANGLRGLAQLGPVSTDEIQNLFADPYPAVQFQLISASKAGKVTLPADTVKMLKASPFAGIRAAAKDLTD
jgi:HEAT repeat protein